MTTPTNQSDTTDSPLFYEADGELSLHFGFPTIQSRMLRSDPQRLVLDYTQTMMGFLLFVPEPRHIAMVGLGEESLAKYCRSKLPDCDFTAIELLPEVIALREEFGIPADSSRFRIVCANGADYVRQSRPSLDVLLIDGFNSEGQPPELCSLAFYDACCNALRPDGILVVNLCADDPGYNCYIARIDQAFGGKRVIVEADEGGNKIVFAGKAAPFPPGFKELAERLRSLEARHPVELDKTVQKILHQQQSRTRPTRKRR